MPRYTAGVTRPKKKRRYDMTRRVARQEATRQLIALAARQLFNVRWYDEVSLADVAKQSRVSLATVTRLFPSKSRLLLAAVLAEPPSEEARGWGPGDVHEAVGALVDSYEAVGAWIVRSYALGLRLPELTPVIEQTQHMT